MGGPCLVETPPGSCFQICCCYEDRFQFVFSLASFLQICFSYDSWGQLVGWSETGGESRRLLILTLMMYSCSFADSSQRILKLLLETDEGGGGGDLRPKGVTTVPSKTASNPGMKWRSVGVWLVSRWRPEKDILQKSRPASSFAISIAFQRLRLGRVGERVGLQSSNTGR